MTHAEPFAADHYRVLQVDPGADSADIRAAYLRLMRQTHPDLHPADPAAAVRARQLNAAYAVLSSPAARARYDRARQAAGLAPDRAGRRNTPTAHPRSVSPERAPYSREQHDLRAAFSAASLRLGTAVFALGAVLLLALTLR